jgi:hypothetical protein
MVKQYSDYLSLKLANSLLQPNEPEQANQVISKEAK